MYLQVDRGRNQSFCVDGDSISVIAIIGIFFAFILVSVVSVAIVVNYSRHSQVFEEGLRSVGLDFAAEGGLNGVFFKLILSRRC